MIGPGSTLSASGLLNHTGVPLSATRFTNRKFAQDATFSSCAAASRMASSLLKSGKTNFGSR